MNFHVKETMVALHTDQLCRSIQTLERSLERLLASQPETTDYEVFRNATVKGFELTLETAGTLLRKALKPFFATAKEVDLLTFKDVFRYAAKHGFVPEATVERWFVYRDNRNNTAHDYGKMFAEETVSLLPAFISDARTLEQRLRDVRT